MEKDGARLHVKPLYMGLHDRFKRLSASHIGLCEEAGGLFSHEDLVIAKYGAGGRLHKASG